MYAIRLRLNHAQVEAIFTFGEHSQERPEAHMESDHAIIC